jgi:hypothetical protein
MGPGNDRASGWRTVGLALLLVAIALTGLASTPPVGGSLAIDYLGHGTAGSGSTFGPLTAGTSSAVVGGCTATLNATVPSTAGGPRASVAVVEPYSCVGRARFALGPGLGFTNGLATTSGHTLIASLAIVSVGGTTSLLRSIHLNLETTSGSVVTSQPAELLRGVVQVASSSSLTLAAGTRYGLAVSMLLLRPATSSTADLALVLQFVLDDGGVARAVVDESVALSVTY